MQIPRLLLFLAFWSLAPSRADVLFKQNILAKLGFSIYLDSTLDHVESPHILNCQFNSPSDLTLWMPAQPKEQEIDAILEGPIVRCLYDIALGDAVRRATTKLANNKMYMFNTFLGDGSARLDGLSGWRKQSCRFPVNEDTKNEKCYIAENPALAVESLYEPTPFGFATECFTGLLLAEYASIYELFGRENFNHYFSPQEIFVSDPANTKVSQSIVHGQGAASVADLTGLSSARRGYQAMVGLSGAIGALKDPSFLNQKDDGAENFLIVSSSQAAAETLVAHGGLQYYAAMTEKIWRLSANLLSEDYGILQHPGFGTSALSQTGQNIYQLLQDPFLQDVKVYVHDLGVQSLAWHIARLLRVNPRTPYQIWYYPENEHSEIFERWLKMLKGSRIFF